MKKIIVALFVMAFAIAGALTLNLTTAEAGACPGKSPLGTCNKIDTQSADGAIGTTANTATSVGVCRLLTPSSYAVFALRRYASVSTGAIVAPHIYQLSITSPRDAQINEIFANGVYADALTGTVYSQCEYRK